MPSFDIVNKIDVQKLDNAINAARKEIVTRYDFNNSKTNIDFDKKTNTLNVLTENEMRMDAIESVLISRLIKQGIDAKCLDFGKEQYASGSMVRKDIKIKEGIDKDAGRKIVKIIKDSGLKVQAAMMDEQLRVTGKKLDDLQSTMAVVRSADLEVPVQFDNFRS